MNEIMFVKMKYRLNNKKKSNYFLSLNNKFETLKHFTTLITTGTYCT